MNFSRILSTDPLEHPAMDYSLLRQEGIRQLERLAKQLWTDFNTHDPGITLLEQICYALTDLAYRINYSVPDLLSSQGVDTYASLYTPAQILPSYPVTLNDLRKLVIDVNGVKNAWLDKAQAIPLYFDACTNTLCIQKQAITAEPIDLQGLYQVGFEIFEWLTVAGAAEYQETILWHVAHRLRVHRGLGEDFATIQPLDPQDIQVQAWIEIDAVEEANSMLLAIYKKIADYISPPIRFSSLREQRQAGKSVDEIFDGPLLTHGFIETEVLEQAQRRTTLRTSDLIHAIMDVPGVKAVTHIYISASESEGGPWSLDLDPNKAPRLDVHGSNICLERNRLAVSTNVAGVRQAYYQRLRQSDVAPGPAAWDWPVPAEPVPAGRDRNVKNYYSIQHQLPATYGIGAMGLPDSAPPLRQAQAKQLQAYLLFFDQLLANDFSQLAHVSNLFSFTDARAQTYFSQVITDPTLGIDDIYSTDITTHQERLQQITENPEAGANRIDPPVDFNRHNKQFNRRNRFVNHLLARFAEQFTDYSSFVDSTAEANIPAPAQLVQDKQAFLQDYPQLSRARGTAAGLEQRLRRKLGIKAENEMERFYIVEHILLRPMEQDSQQKVPILANPQSKDPYSLQISFVFPEKASRFKNPDFKAFLERTLYEETPAHLSWAIYWFEQSDMEAFASAYLDWLDNWHTYWQKTPKRQTAKTVTHIQLRDARDRLIDLLGFGETYPLRDLTVIAPMVVFGAATKIVIENSQKDVLYQLHHECTVVVTPEGGLIQKEGTGDTISLATNKIKDDTTFEILAIKQPSGRKAYLHQTATVKVGIDSTLNACIILCLPCLNFLDRENTATTFCIAPCIANYGDCVIVKIEKSQEKVDYRLVYFNEDYEETVLSHKKTGTLDDIILKTWPVSEDIDIRIRATKTFEPAPNKERDVVLLDAVLPLKVRANWDLSVSVVEPIIDYNSDATIQIANTQLGTTYQLYIRPIPDQDFIHGDPGITNVITVEVSDEEPDAQIREPAWNKKWNDTWAESEGYTAYRDPKTGTGDEQLQFTIDSLTEDHLVIIKAKKSHQDPDAKKTIYSAVQLKQAAVVLVRPNPTPSIYITILERTETSGKLQVFGGQQGVFYDFSATSEGEALGLPAYFQKWDKEEHSYKGLEKLTIEVDYVIAGDFPNALEKPIVETGPLPDDPTALYVHAIKAQTGVATDLTQWKIVDATEEE